MTRVRVVSVLLGAAFGFLISWGQFVDPERIRHMLLLDDAYMWLMFALAVGVAFAGIRLLRRAGARARVTGEPVGWTTARPERRHVAGAALFGVGWAVSDVCPGPVAAQLGQGVAWSVVLLAGVAVGIEAWHRRHERRAAAHRAPAGAVLPASSPD